MRKYLEMGRDEKATIGTLGIPEGSEIVETIQEVTGRAKEEVVRKYKEMRGG